MALAGFIVMLFSLKLHAQQNDTLNIPAGKINQYKLTYDCHGCHSAISESITVHYWQNGKKTSLLDQVIFDFYVDEVSPFKWKGFDFVYVGSTHTYGHSQGYLFYINTATMKAYPVKINNSNYKIADSIHTRKYFELTRKPNNKFTYSASTFTETGKTGYLEGYYSLKKTGNNKFVAVCSKPEIYFDDENY